MESFEFLATTGPANHNTGWRQIQVHNSPAVPDESATSRRTIIADRIAEQYRSIPWGRLAGHCVQQFSRSGQVTHDFGCPVPVLPAVLHERISRRRSCRKPARESPGRAAGAASYGATSCGRCDGPARAHLDLCIQLRHAFRRIEQVAEELQRQIDAWKMSMAQAVASRLIQGWCCNCGTVPLL